MPKKNYCEWVVTVSEIDTHSRCVYYKDMGCNPFSPFGDSSYHFTLEQQTTSLRFCPHCGRTIIFAGYKMR